MVDDQANSKSDKKSIDNYYGLLVSRISGPIRDGDPVLFCLHSNCSFCED